MPTFPIHPIHPAIRSFRFQLNIIDVHPKVRGGDGIAQYPFKDTKSTDRIPFDAGWTTG
jgi:hypothetical protein